MKRLRFGLELTNLKSKIARRIFLYFLLCALLPLCIFAFISLQQMRNHLMTNADARLRQASKEFSMAAVEKLQFLEEDLLLAYLRLSNSSSKSPDAGADGMLAHLRTRFKSVALAQGGRTVHYIGTGDPLPALDEEEKRFLAEGNALITSRTDAGKRGADLIMIRGVNPEYPLQALMYGEIDPEYLWRQNGIMDGGMALHVFDEKGFLLYSSISGAVPFSELEAALRKDPHAGILGWHDGSDRYQAGYWQLFLRPSFYHSVVIVHSETKAGILQPVNQYTVTLLGLAALTFWTVGLLSIGFIRKRMVPIERLKQAAENIGKRDFSSRVQIESDDEFEELGTSFNAMADSLSNYIDIMHTINGIGISLSAEASNRRLMETVLEGARKVVNADCAMLFLTDGEERMRLELMHIKSLSLWIDDKKDAGEGIFEGIRRLSSSVYIPRDTVNVDDVYAIDMPGFEFVKAADEKLGYRTRSLLRVPMRNHEDEIIGMLHLGNIVGPSGGDIVPFSPEGQQLVESLASQSAVALTKNRLILEFKRLFEDLTKLIGTAVDEKSPYTGEHCKRVPELTSMIAEAVGNAKSGAFREVALTPEELYELKISALLHDCGKVTTPVHIVDKSRKLETIFDRIQLIKTRFEVIKRDYRLQLMKEAAGSNGKAKDLVEIDRKAAAFERSLDEDSEFLGRCNIGAESMNEEDQKRIVAIAGKYSWTGYEGKREPAITADEMYNLSIAKGTLTPKERRTVNSHIETSIRMLNSLHYPKSLRNVPVHAGSHHERVDGRGYPRGLAGDEITLQAKIIAIADTFEALTASNRPYQKPRKLSEVMHMLHEMKEEGRLDPDLYDLFISERIYVRYARQFLRPDQIDLPL